MTGIDVPAAGAVAVADLIGSPVVRISEDATVAAAAQAIIKAGVGAVLVGEDDRPVALLSERDVALIVASGRNPAAVLAADVASTDLVWCAATDTVDAAALRMTDRHIRHLLVEDGNILVGIVSARDLLGVYASDADLEPTR